MNYTVCKCVPYTVRKQVPYTVCKMVSQQHCQMITQRKCWMVPVLANGRIYCRSADGDLACVDVHKK